MKRGFSIYVVDTSYLVELFQIPGLCSKENKDPIKQKFNSAFENNDRLYVPLSVIFEMGNHIAQIKNAIKRKELSKKLSETLKTCADEGVPFVVRATDLHDSLYHLSKVLDMCDAFAKQFSYAKIGLTDISVIFEANDLKKNDHEVNVHIWTLDKEQKSHEPDSEPNSFL